MTRRSGGHQASIGLNAAQGPLVATYQTRISDYGDMDRLEGDAALSAYGVNDGLEMSHFYGLKLNHLVFAQRFGQCA